MADGSRKAILAALFANLGIALSKLVGFVVTQSAGMLAEAIHSLADTGNQALLLLGGSRARKEATPTHPFGYGRERYFWSFAVSLVLFSVGGLFALTEGIDKFRHPHEIESVWVAIGILLIAIAVVLMIEMKSLLIGESASRADEDAITGALSAGPGVRGIVHLKTQHLGPEEILVAAKLEFDAALTFEQLVDAIDATEALVRTAASAASIIYIEPGRPAPAP